MKIYVSHASSFNYQTELYGPVQATVDVEHELFLPHASNSQGVLSRDIIPQCDLVLAEVSHPSTGQGIELGWASSTGIPIVCLYKAGSTFSSSLRFVSSTFIEYVSSDDMSKKLKLILQDFSQ